MTASPIISVIVPVYNVDKYLPRCLDSILKQSIRNIEVICVDDGSTDSSAKILSTYAMQDDRVRIISQENQGIAAARNAGLNVASGHYISFIDSDDKISPKLYEKLLAHKLEDIDAVCFSAQVIEEFGAEEKLLNSKGFEVKFSGKVLLQDEDILQLTPTVWDKLFLRKNIESIRLRFSNGIWHEDNAFVYNYFSIYRKVYFEQDKLYFYYQRSNSFMDGVRKKKEGLAFHYIKIIDYIYEFWTSHNLFPEKQKLFELITLRLFRSAIGTANQWETSGLVYALTCSIRKWRFEPYDNILNEIAKGDIAITVGKYPFAIDIYNLKKLKGFERIFYVKNAGPYKVIGLFGIRIFYWYRNI